MRYWKPTSLTWWAGVAMIGAGLGQATEPMHGYEAFAESVKLAYGMGPAVLINAGLATIGLRGAVK